MGMDWFHKRSQRHWVSSSWAGLLRTGCSEHHSFTGSQESELTQQHITHTHYCSVFKWLIFLETKIAITNYHKLGQKYILSQLCRPEVWNQVIRTGLSPRAIIQATILIIHTKECIKYVWIVSRKENEHSPLGLRNKTLWILEKPTLSIPF